MGRCNPYVPSTYCGKILIVGDFPTLKESETGIPFDSGYARELWSQCQTAKIIHSECAVTNVFQDRMQAGNIHNICLKKKEVTAEAKDLGWSDYPLKPLAQGKYIRPYHCLELLRLRQEIEDIAPNLVIALGNTALWALTGTSGIGKYRGVIQIPTAGAAKGFKVLPTYSPKVVYKDYSKRVICIMDFIKARAESEMCYHKKPERFIYIPDTVEDIYKFFSEHTFSGRPSPPKIWVDLETKRNQFISFFGIAVSETEVIVIPFFNSNDGKRFKHYWKTDEEELEVWQIIKHVIESAPYICGQNFMYDLQYQGLYGIKSNGFCQDTMLMQHAMYPELPKGLAFLGSIFTDESAWKEEHKRGKQTQFKADD